MPDRLYDHMLSFDSPLGRDALVLTGLEGDEAISQPFRFVLDLAADSPSVEAAALLGHQACVRAGLPSGEVRYIHGIVSRFRATSAQRGRGSYEAELVPWLWTLSLSSDCRIFQHRSVPEIVAAVFNEAGFKDFELRLNRRYPQREYCVQYRETHFAFVSRLLEDEGIFYFFEHGSDRHTLVLGDSPAAVRRSPWVPRLRMVALSEVDPRAGEEATAALAIDHTVQHRSVTLADYDYLAPSARLGTTVSGRDGIGELFDYPGGYTEWSEGDRYANLRLEEAEARSRTAVGESAAPGLASGYTVEVAGGATAAANGSWLVTAVRHVARAPRERHNLWLDDSEPSYKNYFMLVPADARWHPPRVTPRPRVHGTQSAVVVGPPGEELHTDAHGRVKLHFHWDRRGKRDGTSSCWVRCATTWAGRQWGQLSLPRVGQEVLVAFLEGDPDRPVVVGRVYNADQPPPFDPGGTGGVVSGVRSRTHRGTGHNAIEMDDRTGAELLALRGERDVRVESGHDQRVSVGNDLMISVGGGETSSVGGDRTATVAGAETGAVGRDRAWKVDGDDSLTVGGARSEAVTHDATETVGRSRTLRVGTDHHVDVGGASETTVAGGMAERVAGSRALHVGEELLLEARDRIVLRAGDASITVTRDGAIVIDGDSITIRGAGDLVVRHTPKPARGDSA